MTDCNIILGEYLNNNCYRLTEFEPWYVKMPLILIHTFCVDPDPDNSKGFSDVISKLEPNSNRYKHVNILKLTARKFWLLVLRSVLC